MCYDSINRYHFSAGDEGDDLDDHWSTNSYVIYSSNSLMCRMAKKQPIIARFSIDSENKPIANTTTELLEFQSLLFELESLAPLLPHYAVII